MVATAQWTYAQREPISWSMGILVGLVVLWGLTGWQVQPAANQSPEMTAFLDMPALKEAPVTPRANPAPTLVRPAVATALNQSSPVSDVVTPPTPAATAFAETGPRISDNKAAAAVAAPPVTAAPTTPAPETLRSAASTSYESQILAYLERIKRYPTSREARLSQPQGVVKLWLDIARNGSLLAAGIISSSGSNILDSEALRTVRTAQLPAFPENAFPQEASHRFSVSLKYQIESQ